MLSSQSRALWRVLRVERETSLFLMPALLLNGRVVGKWKKKNTKLTVTLFEQVRAEDRKAIVSHGEALWSDLKKIEFEE